MRGGPSGDRRCSAPGERPTGSKVDYHRAIRPSALTLQPLAPRDFRGRWWVHSIVARHHVTRPLVAGDHDPRRRHPAVHQLERCRLRTRIEQLLAVAQPALSRALESRPVAVPAPTASATCGSGGRRERQTPLALQSIVALRFDTDTRQCHGAGAWSAFSDETEKRTMGTVNEISAITAKLFSGAQFQSCFMPAEYSPVPQSDSIRIRSARSCPAGLRE